MSTVVANSISGNELFLFADTIVTRTGDQNAHTGFTSHGEIYQPIVQKDNSVVGFSESACKVGRLTDRIAIGIAGHVDFAYAMLDMIFQARDRIIDRKSLWEYLQSAAVNQSPSTFTIGSRAELLFCIAGIELEIGLCTFEVGNLREIQTQLDVRAVNYKQGYQKIVGSGESILSGYLPEEIFKSCGADPSLLSVGIQMLSMDYSRELRRRTRNQAAGVGGAFLGLKVDRFGVHGPRDTLHISVDQSGVVHYCTKIAYDNELFYITDYIRRSVNVVRTVDEELSYRARKPAKNTDITEKLKRGVSFAAPIILLSYFEDPNNPYPITSIIESDKENAIKGTAPPEGFVWFERNTPISFGLANGQERTFHIP